MRNSRSRSRHGYRRFFHAVPEGMTEGNFRFPDCKLECDRTWAKCSVHNEALADTRRWPSPCARDRACWVALDRWIGNRRHVRIARIQAGGSHRNTAPGRCTRVERYRCGKYRFGDAATKRSRLVRIRALHAEGSNRTLWAGLACAPDTPLMR